MNYKLVSLLSLFAILLGGVAGYFLPDVMISIGFIGTLFVNGLQLLVFPVLLVFAVAGISQMKDRGKIRRSFGKTSLYVLTVSFTASLFGLLMSMLFQSGVGIDKAGAHIPEELIPMMNDFSVISVIGSMIPKSFFEASLTVKLFGMLLFAVLLGTALSKFKKSNKVVTDFFASSNEIMNDLLRYIQYIIPIGLFSLVGTAFAVDGGHTSLMLSSLFMFSLLIIFSLSFFALVILPLGMRLYTNQSGYELFAQVVPALTTAFATNSQAATLPVTKYCVDNDDIIDERAGAFVLPFGAIFNSCGTALFLAASSVFVAQMYDVSLTIMQMLGILFVSTLISLIANFIPMTSLLILALVVSFSNLPIHVTAGLGLLVLLEFLFSRVRTVVNVWADIVGTSILSETFDFKTVAVARQPVKRSSSKDSRTAPRQPRNSRTKDARSNDRRQDRNKKSDNNRTKSRERYDKKNANGAKPDKRQTKPKVTDKPKAKETAKPVREEKPVQKTENKKKFEMPPVPYHLLENELKPKPKVEKEEVKQEKPAETKQLKPADTNQEKPAETKQVKPVEVKPEKKVEAKKEVKTKEEDSVIVKAKSALSQDTIKREREKISAQLESMRKREANITIEPIEESEIEPVKPEQSAEKKTETVKDKSESKPAEQKTVTPEVETVEKPSTSNQSTHVDFLAADFTKIPDTPEKDNGNSQKDKPLEAVGVDSQSSSTKVEYGRGRSKKSEKAKKESATDKQPESDNSKPAEPEFSKEEMTFGRGRKKK